MLVSAQGGTKRSAAIKLLIAVTFLCALAVAGSTSTARAEIPDFDGLMTFRVIHDASGPEEYSWKVHLAPNQGLEQLDDQTAAVYYVNDHTTALKISAEAAHDAKGTRVPTTLAVSDGDIITLTVHHRAGNPEADGESFDYPIMAGPSWSGSYETVIVQGPPDEAELKEMRERQEREAREASEAKEREEVHCVVPVLKGKSLRASRKILVRNGCSLGRVALRKTDSKKSAKVVSQSHWAGAVLKPGAPVGVKLA